MDPLDKTFQEIQKRAVAVSDLTDERRASLKQISDYLKGCEKEKRKALLNFICTHNSRRSHLGQFAAMLIAEKSGLARDQSPGESIEAMSGGTEATAVAVQTIEALTRLGFEIEAPESETGKNPVYRYRGAAGVIPVYSKVYETKRPFAAILVCSSADAACPIVHGSEARIRLPFEDPKRFDNLGPDAVDHYIETFFEIASELYPALTGQI